MVDPDSPVSEAIESTESRRARRRLAFSIVGGFLILVGALVSSAYLGGRDNAPVGMPPAIAAPTQTTVSGTDLSSTLFDGQPSTHTLEIDARFAGRAVESIIAQLEDNLVKRDRLSELGPYWWYTEEFREYQAALRALWIRGGDNRQYVIGFLRNQEPRRAVGLAERIPDGWAASEDGLADALPGDGDRFVFIAATSLLARIRDQENFMRAIPLLIESQRMTDETQKAVERFLQLSKKESGIMEARREKLKTILSGLLNSPDPGTRESAESALHSFFSEEAAQKRNTLNTRKE